MEPNHASASAAANSAQPTPAGVNQPLVIPVIEEQAVLTREVVKTGRVRLAKTVHEREELLEIPLQHEEVIVERVPVNQFVPDGAATPGLRYDGDTTIIPVLREVVVTRLLVVEEIRVTKRTQTTTHTQPVVLRHEEVQVNRFPALGTTPDGPAAAPPSAE